MTGVIVLLCVLLLAVSLQTAQGAFLDAYENSFVELVEPTNFNEKVMEYDGTVIVQFYTSWSPNCKKFASVWVEAAEVLKSEGSTVRFALMDADNYREFTRRFKIDGYPTIISFGKFTKELPTYALSTDSTLPTVDDIVAHAKELDAKTKDQADVELKDIKQTKGKATGSKKKSDEKKSKSADEIPPKRKKEKKEKKKVKRPIPADDSDDEVPPTIKKPKVKRPEPEVRADPFEHRGARSPRRPRPFDEDRAAPEPIKPMDEPPRPDFPKFEPIKPMAMPGDDDWEERRKNIPPRTPEDDERHQKMVDEHWERVKQRKEEREQRRQRGESNEHDDMYHRHEQMITDARKRHDDHMADVMRRHDEIMADVRRRMDEHRQHMDRHFGRGSNDDAQEPSASIQAADVPEETAAASEPAS